MSAGTTLAAYVPTSVKTFSGPTNAAVPQASSWLLMAEIVMVRGASGTSQKPQLSHCT